MNPAVSVPLKLRIDGSQVVLRSLNDAIGFVRSHPVADHAEMLIAQMEAAHRPDLERRAWVAFSTFADAMRLAPEPAAPRLM